MLLGSGEEEAEEGGDKGCRGSQVFLPRHPYLVHTLGCARKTAEDLAPFPAQAAPPRARPDP